MEELKPCPFCGLEFEIVETVFKNYMIKHDLDCPMYSDGENGNLYYTVEELVSELNTRPLEDALKAENARLRAAARWIPVSERLPECNLSVLIYIAEDNAILEAVYAHDIFWETGDFGLVGVTHWMPKPEPPEDDNAQMS